MESLVKFTILFMSFCNIIYYFKNLREQEQHLNEREIIKKSGSVHKRGRLGRFAVLIRHIVLQDPTVC